MVTSVQRAKTLITTCLALFMAMLDTLVVGVALPSLQSTLHANIAQLEWFMNAYTLVFAVVLLPASILGERYGRRKFFIIGVALFTVGSLLAGLSTSALQLIIARAVQGIGGSAIAPISLALIHNTFPPEKRAGAIGMWSGVSGLGLTIGPLVGGLIVNGLPWHMIFLVNVPVGVLTVIISLVWLRESQGPRVPFDGLGLLFLGTGLLGIVYGLVRGNSVGWVHLSIWGSILLGLVFIIVFWRWEMRQVQPLVDFQLFRRVPYTLLNLSGFWMSAGIFGSIFVLTLFLQEALGYSPLGAGVREMAWTMATMFSAPIAGVLTTRFGVKWVLTAGLLLQVIALGYFAVMTKHSLETTSFINVLPGLVGAGVGMGLSITPLQHGVLSSVTETLVGQASGVSYAIRELGGVFGIAIAGLVFQLGGPVSGAHVFSLHLIPTLWSCAGMVAIGFLCALLLKHTRRQSHVSAPRTV